jgi:preprotein translocase subunit SecA
LKEAVFYSSLDEPLFTYFGGEKIRALLTKLGMNENEAISHSFISKSIAQAQKKLQSRVAIEATAHSAAEWFAKNLPQ